MNKMLNRKVIKHGLSNIFLLVPCAAAMGRCFNDVMNRPLASLWASSCDENSTHSVGRCGLVESAAGGTADERPTGGCGGRWLLTAIKRPKRSLGQTSAENTMCSLFSGSFNRP